jgi:hypothetical protein
MAFAALQHGPHVLRDERIIGLSENRLDFIRVHPPHQLSKSDQPIQEPVKPQIETCVFPTQETIVRQIKRVSTQINLRSTIQSSGCNLPLKNIIDQFSAMDLQKNQSAVQSWLKRKAKSMPATPNVTRPNSVQSTRTKSSSSQANAAFEAWLARKRKPAKVNQEHQEDSSNRYSYERQRDPERSLRAYHEWIERKNEETQRKLDQQELYLYRTRKEQYQRRERSQQAFEQWLNTHEVMVPKRLNIYPHNEPWRPLINDEDTEKCRDPSRLINLEPSPPHMFQDYAKYIGNASPAFMKKYPQLVASAGKPAKEHGRRTKPVGKSKIRTK